MQALRLETFFILNRMLGSHCRNAYREMLAWEFLHPDELRQRQQERLACTLDHARNNVAHYRERVTSSGSLSLSDFPVLRREMIQADFESFMPAPVRARWQGGKRQGEGYSWVLAKTGGTTGTPTTLLHDADFRDSDRAARLYAQHLCGFDFGTPYFRLWGSMREINQLKASRLHRAMAWFAAESMLNAFQMTTEQMDAYLDIVDASSVQFLMTYVDAAAQLAAHAQQRNRRLRPLQSIMCCAGTLTQDTRSQLTHAFSARVHNKYGSRDCGDMACECAHGGLHIFANRCLIEIVNEHDQQVPAGQTGRILVTVFGNPAFPIIRYDIGDRGALADHACACGRSYPLLKCVEGRSAEFLTACDGSLVSPAYACHIIGVVHNPGCVRRFQLIQDARKTFTLNLRFAENTPSDVIQGIGSAIRTDLAAVLGLDADIQITAHADFVQTGDKFLYTLNRFAANPTAI